MKLPTWKFLIQFYRYVLPEVHKELDSWQKRASAIPDPELRQQALASINDKTFHCEGGCVYAAAAVDKRRLLIPLIVAFQTISDYLDNLCDRSTSLDPDDFYCLHQAMLDAVSPDTPLHDYYAVRKNSSEPYEDGGYLQHLVETCRNQILQFPSYALVQQQIVKWTGLYRDLQVYKHVLPAEREQRLINWWQIHRSDACGLPWHEFAAATGSTLGIFALFTEALKSGTTADTVVRLQEAYFPWIAGAHILLDYLVDYEEDRIGGDLNFISYYRDRDDALRSLQRISAKSREAAQRLNDLSPIHAIAVDGLFGMYLADGKVQRQTVIAKMGKSLLSKSAFRSKFFYHVSRWHRGSSAKLQAPRIEKH